MNATPFQKHDGAPGKASTKKGGEETSADGFGKQMAAHGFNYHGTEMMYSGVLGTEFLCEIYIGVVYYQRLRHMVSDKYQVALSIHSPQHPEVYKLALDVNGIVLDCLDYNIGYTYCFCSSSVGPLRVLMLLVSNSFLQHVWAGPFNGHSEPCN